MRWAGQQLSAEAGDVLPGLGKLDELVRSVTTPEFAGVTFHEVLAKSALNRVPDTSRVMPGSWTLNSFRGCQHGCVYCFARPTHTYLDLDPGNDFDRQIIVKINVVQLLERELRSKGDRVDAVNLGTNTDPYQRAEGRYRLMPGIITALADHGKPISILTKGTLIRRDLALLTRVRSQVPVQLAMSIAVFDEELQRTVEPHTPSAAARLATVRAIRDAGFDCTVLMMPILPYLTDQPARLEQALQLIKDAGATAVHAGALYLRPGVKEWFLRWLEQTRPELLPRYAELFRGAYVPSSYRRLLDSRLQPLLRRYGYDRPSRNEPGARSRRASPDRQSAATDRPSSSGETAAGQPSLFDL